MTLRGYKSRRSPLHTHMPSRTIYCSLLTSSPKREKKEGPKEEKRKREEKKRENVGI
jgi:hypothetical protein